MTTLAQQTAVRLATAGIRGNDPGLVKLRAWNRGAYERGRISIQTGPSKYVVTRLETVLQLGRQ
jgi:hypothetical protein